VHSLIGTVPDAWSQALLGELCEIQTGPSGNRIPARAPEPGDVPVVSPRDFHENRIVRGDSAVPPDLAAKLSHYGLAMGDVVCARTGDLGRQALVGPEQKG
jgi:hypothetical protein